jgi:nucleoid-associated protein YgaU
MGLFSFIADAGKKIFGGGHKDADAGQPVQQLNDLQLQALRQHVAGLGLNIKNLDVRLDGPGAITLTGEAATKADYEKAALMAGNVMGITSVTNQMTIAASPQAAAQEADSATHTIVKGDTLWATAEKHYGNGAKYTEIVKANQPMIKDADEIYPGQVLRLPKLAQA